MTLVAVAHTATGGVRGSGGSGDGSGGRGLVVVVIVVAVVWKRVMKWVVAHTAG